MKKTMLYTELAYVLGMVGLSLSVALMTRADFGVSMVVAPAYLLYLKLNPVLRDILRLGAYQILFLDRVPDSAAVNEAVEQAKKQRSPQEAGLCNGLLRNLSRRKAELEMPKDYAVRYSHPAELVDLMKESVGKRLGAILEADNSQPETCAQWNPLRCGEEELLQAWQEESVTVSGHPWLEHCYLLRGTGSLERLPSFQRGMFQVQDAAAEAGQQGEALKVDVRAAVILQRTALQHTEGQPAVAVEADGGVAHGAYALVRGDIAGLNAEREAGEPSFREGLGLGIDHGVVRMGMIGIRRINESLRAVEVERRIVCRRGKFKGQGHSFTGDNHAILLPAV